MLSCAGEVVINSFIDSYEFTALKPNIRVGDVDPKIDENDTRVNETLTEVYEHKPHFHEWL